MTCIAQDDQSGFIWYGTASSTFNCFQMPHSNNDQNQRQQWEVNEAFGGAGNSEKTMQVKDDQVMKIKGLPKIIDKH